MTPEQAAVAAAAGVRYLGTAFAVDPRTLRRARERGLAVAPFLVGGFGSALGEVDADVVAAAVGLAAPGAVAAAWAAARRSRPIAEIERLYVAECRRWGAEKLDGFAATGRLADLSAKVVEAADAGGAPLFAAWRSRGAHLATADGRRGARVGVLMMLLWQHRAGSRVLAARAAGLACPDGGEDALHSAFAGGAPEPAAGPMLRRQVWAEAVADRIAGQAYAVLDPGERAELAGLVRGAAELAALPTGELPQVRASEHARAYLRTG